MHYNVLSDYGIVGSLSAITADNASTNSAMARALSCMEHVEFNHKEQLFGCMAHVIHLAAMDGIKALGGRYYINNEEEDSAATCVMSVHNITTQPDGFDVNLATVIKRVHGMSVYVRSSDQRRQRFAQAVEYHQQGSTVNCLILDVKTRWNSTYQMCSRFLHLRYVLVNCLFCLIGTNRFSFRFDSPTVTGVCLSDVDYQKFALLNEEWEKLGQLMKFLQPLNTATERLASSRFPTLEKALPIFFALIVQLQKVRSYDL
jgi:hypothetical protein